MLRPRALGLLTLALALAATTAPAGAQAEAPFSVGRVFFQLNDTDGDLGFHALLDGEAWKTVTIKDPADRLLLQVNVRGRLLQQGLTELAMESAEPGFDELPPAAFFARFPAGTYDIDGFTLDGSELSSESVVSHVLPAPVGNILVSGQPAPADCTVDPGPAVNGAVLLRWNPVTTSHPSIGVAGPVNIDSYEIAVERTSPVLPTKAVFTLNVPGTTTEVEIPSAFLDLGDAFQFQLLARNAGGNETGTVSCFRVANH